MATQYESLDSAELSYDFTDALIAGEMHRSQESIIIVTGHAAMVRGTLLEISGTAGQLKAFDGTGTILGVLAHDTPATTGELRAVMYVTGEFNQALLVGLTSGTEATNRAALKDMGIYAKPVY
jgi:hypothetical protein